MCPRDETKAKSADSDINCIGRRQFLRSIFSIGGAVEASEQAAEAKPVQSRPTNARSNVSWFYWADLKTGQVGFPDGLVVKRARPGSVMKIVTAAMLLEEGFVNPNQYVDCVGHINVNRQTINCQFAHGRMTLVSAIGKSCNCFFAHATSKLSAKTVIKYAEIFGLNHPVAGQQSGTFPSGITGSALLFALGLDERLQPNALQLLRISGLVATKGNVPYLHSAEAPMAGEKPFIADLKDTTWLRLQQGMQLAVKAGTCKHLDPENKMHIAAKTGTVPHGKKFESWVTGYFPIENPRHAFCLYAAAGTSQDSAIPQVQKKLFATTWP